MKFKILMLVVIMVLLSNIVIAGDVGNLSRNLNWDGFIEKSYQDSTVYTYDKDPSTNYVVYHINSTLDNPQAIKWKINRKDNVVVKGFADRDNFKCTIDICDKDTNFTYSVSSDYVYRDSTLFKDNSLRVDGFLSESELYQYNVKTKKYDYIDEATGFSYNPNIKYHIYKKFKFNDNLGFYSNFYQRYGMDKYRKLWNKE